MLKIIWSYAPCESSQVKIKKKTSNTVEIYQSSRKQRCFVYICQIKLIAFTASVSSYHLEKVLNMNLGVINYMLKVNDWNTRARCEICSRLSIKTLERPHWGRSGVFIFNFENISRRSLVFLLLTLSRLILAEYEKNHRTQLRHLQIVYVRMDSSHPWEISPQRRWDLL